MGVHNLRIEKERQLLRKAARMQLQSRAEQDVRTLKLYGRNREQLAADSEFRKLERSQAPLRWQPTDRMQVEAHKFRVRDVSKEIGGGQFRRSNMRCQGNPSKIEFFGGGQGRFGDAMCGGNSINRRTKPTKSKTRHPSHYATGRSNKAGGMVPILNLSTMGNNMDTTTEVHQATLTLNTSRPFVEEKKQSTVPNSARW